MASQVKVNTKKVPSKQDKKPAPIAVYAHTHIAIHMALTVLAAEINLLLRPIATGAFNFWMPGIFIIVSQIRATNSIYYWFLIGSLV